MKPEIQKPSKIYKSAPTFLLDQLKRYKDHIQPAYALQRALEDNQMRIFKPALVQDNIQLEFRNGEYVYIASKISRVF